MRRSPIFAAALFAASAVFAAEAGKAPAEVPLGATVERCKKTPDFCRALVRAAKARSTAAKEACVPREVSDDEIDGRVMRMAEEILEEDPELKDFGYGTLASQLIVFFYPCDVVA
jgi:hypothetical protein